MADKDGHISKDYLYDVRLLERHVAQGRITREQLDKHLAQIPDLAEQADAVDFGRLSGQAGGRRKQG